jgi:leucyl-tRNA synthetase
MVLAPEHPMVEAVTSDGQRDAVAQYVEDAARTSERARIAEARGKTGVFTGGYAINPVNDEKIPIWIADYVLISYGSGAIMAVPGHDERDYEFAREFGLPIVEVVSGGNISREAYLGQGVAVNSGFLDGRNTSDAKSAMIDWLEERGKGEGAVNYKLRDWVFSRQRYWGEPFPVLHLPDGTTKLVPEDQLPLMLPELDDYRPTGDFEPPLARVKEWIHTTDPETGGPAQRDANTMPQWAGSCWYYLRFCDPTNDEMAWSPEAEKYWMNVDLYVGGAEHAVLHLLYARFWHKVLYDLGLVSTKEPFQKLLSPGMIQGKSYRYFSAEDGSKSYSSADVRFEGETPVHAGSGIALREVWVAPKDVRWGEGERPVAPDVDIDLEEVIEKMAKSRGNVVNPDDVIEEYGADSMRLFEMFIGPLGKAVPWSTDGIAGVARFLQRVHRLFIDDETDALRALPDGPGTEAQQKLLAKTIQKVTEDYEKLSFNTAISALMVFARDVENERPIPREIGTSFLRLLGPMAPHICEELWERLGHTKSIAHERWPDADSALLVEDEVEISVQVQGKMRARVQVPADADQDRAYAVAAANENVSRHIGSREPRRLVYVPGRLLNIVL